MCPFGGPKNETYKVLKSKEAHTETRQLKMLVTKCASTMWDNATVNTNPAWPQVLYMTLGILAPWKSKVIHFFCINRSCSVANLGLKGVE